MKKIKDKEEYESNDIIKNIIRTREEIYKDNKNFEHAKGKLIDYYIYAIKANQAKLEYLIEIAKREGIKMEIVENN